jgi:hypothetical protein
MADTIEEVKQRLSRLYLGKVGVHGIGFSRSQNALRLYVHPEPGADREALLAAVAKEAGPYKVVLVEEERPTLS